MLLDVLLPATGETYEFRVPFDLTVEQASGLMAQMLAQREPARYTAPCGCDLMVAERGSVSAGNQLNPNEAFRALVEQGVLGDGSSVALV